MQEAAVAATPAVKWAVLLAVTQAAMQAVMRAEGKWAAATAAEVTGCLRR